jgi:hypothetical protein
MTSTTHNTTARLLLTTLTTLLVLLATTTTALAAGAPTVTTGAVSEVRRSSARVCGTVNPNGENTTYSFHYEYYENGFVQEATPIEPAGAGETPVEVCATITGLKVREFYKYWLEAQNASGTQDGEENSFLTQGAVERVKVEPATNMTRNGATTEVTLNGSFEPNGYDTHYYFEYWEVGDASAAVRTPTLDAGEAEEVVHVHATINVQTNHSYEFQVEAENTFGVTGPPSQLSFEAPAVEGVQTLPATAVEAESATVHGMLEPNGYDTQYYFACTIGFDEHTVFYAPERPGGDAGSSSESKSVEAQLDDLSGNTSYNCRLVTKNSLGDTVGEDVSVYTRNAAPNVDTVHPAAADVTPTSAAIVGQVGTQNEATTYWVEYVDASGYQPTAVNPYSDGATSAVSKLKAEVRKSYIAAGLNDLSPSTEYHYRVVAENGTGVTYGPDYTLTTVPPTPPDVMTGDATGISATGAILHGTVNAENLHTSYEFEIGGSASYDGAQIFGNAGSGSQAEEVQTALQFLVPGTTYHYRILATNVDGTTYGADHTFTTLNVASPISQPGATPLLSVSATMQFPTEKNVTPAKKTKKVKRKAKKKPAKAPKRCKRTQGKGHKQSSGKCR